MNVSILASTGQPRNQIMANDPSKTANKPRRALLPRSPYPPRVYLSWIALVVISLLYLSGVAQTPFHPDESTYLFMSRDFVTLWTHPLSLSWQPGQEASAPQRYRELDAPLNSYLIGLGEVLTGTPPLAADWDWSKTWAQNKADGGLPTAAQLLVGRLSVAILFPFSLWLIYATGSQVGGWLTGLLSAAFFATNALVLLHTRRAMEESALVFGVCLSLWALTRVKDQPWLMAIATAIAFNAKQTALPLALAGFLAVAWTSWQKRKQIGAILKAVGVFCLIFGGITLLLNPFLWSHPIQAALAAGEARLALTQSQTTATFSKVPAQVLYNPFLRAAAGIANSFILPPAFEDVGNYSQQLASSELAYLRVPWDNLFRGPVAGAILLILAATGLVLYIVKLVPSKAVAWRWAIFLAFLMEGGLLILTLSLPYQRYWMPLVPFTCLWSGLAAGQGFTAIAALLKHLPPRR